MSQLEAVLLDAASLSQLEAASLSLEEALSLWLLDREGAPSPFVSVSFIKSRERELVVSLSRREIEFPLWEREREREGEQLDDRRRPSHPTDKRRASTLHVGFEQLHVCSYAVLRLTFEDHLRKLEAA